MTDVRTVHAIANDDLLRLLGTADVRVFCVHRGGEGSAR